MGKTVIRFDGSEATSSFEVRDIGTSPLTGWKKEASCCWLTQRCILIFYSNGFSTIGSGFLVYRSVRMASSSRLISLPYSICDANKVVRKKIAPYLLLVGRLLVAHMVIKIVHISPAVMSGWNAMVPAVLP